MPKTRKIPGASLRRDGTPGRGVRLDPRAKLASIAAMAVAVALAPNMLCDFALMGVAFAFGSMLGQLRVSAAMLVLYALFITLAQFVPYLYDVGLRTIFSSFLLRMRKVFACGLMAYATVKTTHIDEFMSALTRMRVPRAVTITLAVALRYAPTVREDWGFIKDAMRMRGISPSPLGFIQAPMRTIDCIYVPLLMNASRAADELSMAAVARGIENPIARTCYLHIELRRADLLTFAASLAVVASMLAIRAVA